MRNFDIIVMTLLITSFIFMANIIKKQTFLQWQASIDEQQQKINELQQQLDKQKMFLDIEKFFEVMHLYFDQEKYINVSIHYSNVYNGQMVFSATGQRNGQYDPIFTDEIKNLGAQFFLPKLDWEHFTDEQIKEKIVYASQYKIDEEKSFRLFNTKNGVVNQEEFVKEYFKKDQLVAEYKHFIYDQMLDNKEHHSLPSKLKI